MKKRILVIDDDAHTLRVVSMWLSRHGFEVLEARDGAAGLSLWESAAPDAVITDINMPVLDGVEVVTRIAGSGEWCVPIVVLTNRCDHTEIRERLDATGARFLAKPFSPSQLLQLMQTILNEPAGTGRAETSPAEEVRST